MKRFIKLTIALFAVALVGAAWGLELPAAEDNCARRNATAGSVSSGITDGVAGCGRCCLSWWCPNDYCPKVCPSFCRPSLRGCCDDYCPKRTPCFCMPQAYGRCDDYRLKPAPCISWPCRWPDFYRCPPPRLR